MINTEEMLILDMALNTDASVGEVAAAFGVTEEYVEELVATKAGFIGH